MKIVIIFVINALNCKIEKKKNQALNCKIDNGADINVISINNCLRFGKKN